MPFGNDIMKCMATSTKKTDIEFHLLSLELSPSVKPAKSSNHMVGIDLICPKVGTARKANSRTVVLEKGRYAPEAPMWSESVICKETVSGRFGVEVTVTEAVSDSIASYFVNNAANLLVKILAGSFGKAMPVKSLEDIAEIPLSTLSKTILKDKAPEILFSGCADFTGDENFSEKKTIEIPLRAAKDILKSVTTRSARKSEQVTTKKKIVAKGEVVGICRISMEAI